MSFVQCSLWTAVQVQLKHRIQDWKRKPAKTKKKKSIKYILCGTLPKEVVNPLFGCCVARRSSASVNALTQCWPFEVLFVPEIEHGTGFHCCVFSEVDESVDLTHYWVFPQYRNRGRHIRKTTWHTMFQERWGQCWGEKHGVFPERCSNLQHSECEAVGRSLRNTDWL